MKNQVIKVLSKEHGKKVIEYWKSKGVDTGEFDGSNPNVHYGVINGSFEWWFQSEVDKYNPEIIELPEEAKSTFDRLPVEIQEKMLERQVEQGNKRDEGVFREYLRHSSGYGGFTWDETPEGSKFWHGILDNGNHELFYQRYPKHNQTPYEMLSELHNEKCSTKKQPEPTYPCIMWVWDDVKKYAEQRLIEGILANRYITIQGESTCHFYGFKNASLTNPNKDKIQQEIKELEAKIEELKKQL